MNLPGFFALDIGFGNMYLRDHATATGDTGDVYVIQFIASAASHTIKYTNWGHICQNCTELVLDNVRLYPVAQLSPTIPPCSTNIVLGANANPTATSCGQCNGSATASAVNGTGPFSYLWSNGQTTSVLTAVCAGDYWVTITDANLDTAVATVTIAPSGSITALIQSPDSSFCQGDSVQICSNGTFQNYLWSTGSSASCIYANAAANYVLTVTDNNGCTAVSNTIPVSVYPHPAVTATTLTPVICANDSSQVCSTTGFASYFWNTGATTTCIIATHAGNYYVTVTDANGCTAVSNHLAVNTYPLSPVSVSVNGDTLTAFNAVTYQWYFNNQPINNATNAVYIATQSGIYMVEISDTNGCHVTSNNINVTVSGIHTITTSAGIKVYPNPSHNTWQLEVENDWLNSTIEVVDAEGRLVFKSEIENQQSAISFDAAHGIYTLHIYNHQKNATQKLVRW